MAWGQRLPKTFPAVFISSWRDGEEIGWNSGKEGEQLDDHEEVFKEDRKGERQKPLKVTEGIGI